MFETAAGTVPVPEPLDDVGSATFVMSLSTDVSDVSIFTVLPSTATTYSSWGWGLVVAATYSGRRYTIELAIGTISVSPRRTSDWCWSSKVMSDDTVLFA